MNRECFYFIDNVLVQVKYVFLLDYSLVLFLFRLMSVGGIWKKKKKFGSNRRNPLNNSIDR